MKTRPLAIKKNEVVKPVELTAEEKREQALNYIERRLKGGADSAKELTAELAQNLAKSLGEAECQIRWLQGKYRKIVFGQYCEAAMKEGTGLKEGLDMMLNVAKARFKCWAPESSSSPFSNACKSEEFLALRDFIEKFEAVNQEVQA